MRLRKKLKMYWIFTLSFCSSFVFGEGADNSPRIYSLYIRTDIQFRFATTLVTSRVANPANISQETEFKVILPEEAFISNFTLEIDGVIYPGIVKDRKKAKRQYEEAKEKGETTGLVSQEPRETRTFSINISVAAFSKATFNLTYQELLARIKGAYEHKIYVDPGYPVKDLRINVAIIESREITKLYVPPIRALDELLTNRISTKENDLVVITRPTKQSAYISYSPTIDDQDTDGVSGSFVVHYDIDRALDGGDILVVNGYFVHFLAPDVKAFIPKDVVFILDVSGSMVGTKIKQLKVAMGSILDELEEGDRFNIIKFASYVTIYEEEGMIEASQRSIRKAKKYVNEIGANDETDINEAILKGIEILQTFNDENSKRSKVILFLTDGDPTEGIQSPKRILSNIRYTNEGEIPIYSIAFGKDAYWKLVQNMAIQNDGVARKIYEDADADLQISGFFDEISVTLMNNISVKYLGDSVDNESLTQTEFKKFFEGSELVIAGKLTEPTAPTVDMEIYGNSQNGDLVLTVDKDSNIMGVSDAEKLMGIGDFKEITEKTWAYLTIKQMINKANSLYNRTNAKDLYVRAKKLSLKYNFVTPMTSLIVTKQKIRQQKWKQKTGPKPRKPGSLYVKSYSGGGGGGGGYGGGGGGDPHYMIRIKDIEHPICFDVPSNGGEIHNVITDPRNNVTLNTLIINGGIDENGRRKTYIGEIALQTTHHIMIITPSAIIFDTKVFKWKEEKLKHFGGHHFLLFEDGHLCTVTFKFGAVLLIKRHHTKDTGMGYLNIYVQHEDRFSKRTTGLIGQFVNGHKHIHLQKQLVNKSGLTEARLQIKEGPKFPRSRGYHLIDNDTGYDVVNSTGTHTRHRITARLIQRGEIVEKGKEMCWMVLKPFAETLIGRKERFVKTALFVDF